MNVTIGEYLINPVSDDGTAVSALQSFYRNSNNNEKFAGIGISLMIDAGFDIRPTLYLKSSVKITSGDGSKTNPFQSTL